MEEKSSALRRLLIRLIASSRRRAFPRPNPRSTCTTSSGPRPRVYFAPFPAEDYHQQYLEKNPGGYCNHGPTGVSCPVGVLQGA